jgi:hypothetical protein
LDEPTEKAGTLKPFLYATTTAIVLGILILGGLGGKRRLWLVRHPDRRNEARE